MYVCAHLDVQHFVKDAAPGGQYGPHSADGLLLGAHHEGHVAQLGQVGEEPEVGGQARLVLEVFFFLKINTPTHAGGGVDGGQLR